MGINIDRIRNVILAFLVFLSLFLTYKLWTAGRNIGEEDTGGQLTRTVASSVSHERSDVFRPTKVVLHDEDDSENVMVSRTYPLRSLMRRTFEETTYGQLIRSEIKDYEQYMNDLQDSSWIEFMYMEELPFGILEQKFDGLSQDAENSFFNRMLINVNDQSNVYFYNTKSEMFYVVSVLEGQELHTEVFLNPDNLQYVESFPIILENNIIYLPSESLTVPYRSYVIDQLANSVYINSFFPDTSSVDVRSTGNLTRYIDLTKEVSINENSETLNYLRQITDTGELDPTTRYLRSFDQVNRFENWGDTFVLSAYDQANQLITFRRELEGVPVFSPFDFESVTEISIVESGVTRLKLPLRFIQTPIALPESDEGESGRTLMSGTDLLAEIESKITPHMYSQVEDITLGYSWNESEENNQVVHFTPEWYISINGTWMTYNDVLRLQEEEAYGF